MIISAVTAGRVAVTTHLWRLDLPLLSKRSFCKADSMSASVVPGAKLDNCTVKGPAVPLIERPALCSPFLRTDWLPLDATNELFLDVVTLALPLSISCTIRELRTVYWSSRSRPFRKECEGVVEEGREGGLLEFFCVDTLVDEDLCFERQYNLTDCCKRPTFWTPIRLARLGDLGSLSFWGFLAFWFDFDRPKIWFARFSLFFLARSISNSQQQFTVSERITSTYQHESKPRTNWNSLLPFWGRPWVKCCDFVLDQLL